MCKHSKILGLFFSSLLIVCFFANCNSLKKNIKIREKIEDTYQSDTIDLDQRIDNPTLTLTKTTDSFQYIFEYISDIKIGNIPFNDQNNVSLALLPKTNALLANLQDSTNLEFMINLNIYNPKSDSVLLKKLNYTLLVDQKVLVKDTLVDSIVFSPDAANEYSLWIETNIDTYLNSFKDPKDATDALKGFLHLNNRVLQTTLLIDSIEYVIKDKVFLDIDGTKIKF